MFQSCQTWSGNYNTLEFTSVVTTSLGYWTQAITMSSYYHFPLEPNNFQGKKSLSFGFMDPQEREGFQGGYRLSTTWNPSLSHLSNHTMGAHNTSRAPRIILLWIWTKEGDWDEIPQFSPKALHKLPIPAHLETHFHFFLARSLLLKKQKNKKNPIPFISGDPIQCINPLFMCFIYIHTHT